MYRVKQNSIKAKLFMEEVRLCGHYSGAQVNLLSAGKQKKRKTASADIYWCVVKGFEKTMISIFKDLTLHLCC